MSMLVIATSAATRLFDQDLARWRTTILSASPLCLVLLGIVGCGTSDPKGHGGRDRMTASTEVTTNNGSNGGIASVMLARVELPGETTIRIAAIPCVRPATCYEFAEYQEEPAKYAPWSHKKNGMVNTGLVATGPAITQAGLAERATLNLVVERGCSHSQPYALAHGLLRQAHDRVVDEVGGRSVNMEKAKIPSSVHPEGALVYGLLPRGTNSIVVRTPSGKVVSRTDWMGSSERRACHKA